MVVVQRREAARALSQRATRGAMGRLWSFVAARGRPRWVAIGPALLLGLAPVACRETSRAELGAAQYRDYCAACHGAIGADGAVTGRKPDAPDLTALAARFGSPLRRDELAAFVDGRSEVLAHGTREMPAWGARLYEDYPQTPGTEAVRSGTIELLVDYLESVQRR
jgi:mono/diheme cytochrome c family protein